MLGGCPRKPFRIRVAWRCDGEAEVHRGSQDLPAAAATPCLELSVALAPPCRQLDEVVGGADEAPLVADLVQPAQ